jgi:uncharacterized protein
MKPVKILYYVVLVAMVPILYAVFFQKDGSHTVYISQIEKERTDKHRFMQANSESPFIEQEVPYNGLNYFPVNPDFQIKARFERLPGNEKVILATSDNLTKTYIRYAIASFRKEKETHELLILKPTTNEDYLFLAFTDLTSAESTYGAGRYLELKEPKSGKTIVIDFNKAYNPYCAYVDGYSCPMPPAENHLGIAIKAGEKNYE